MGVLSNDTDLSARSATDSWQGQRVGFVDPTLWALCLSSATPTMLSSIRSAKGLPTSQKQFPRTEDPFNNPCP